MRSLTRSWGSRPEPGTVLALTIGASIAIFSVVNTVLLQPLAYPDAERLQSPSRRCGPIPDAPARISQALIFDWQAENDVFEQLAAHSGVTKPGHRRRPGRVCQLRVRLAEFFAVFGQSASAGRLLTQDDVLSAQTRPRSPSWRITGPRSLRQ